MNEILQAVLTAAGSAAAVYGVIKTELYYLRRDIDATQAELRRIVTDLARFERSLITHGRRASDHSDKSQEGI